ncbi:MAG: class I SAM-dependent methyltransferase [Alphaproteobacteria bacterium]
MAAGARDLAGYRDRWLAKPVLRALYTDMYRRMAAELAPGPTLELGGGSGNFASFAPDVIATDIIAAPWLDAVCDAQQLPFADGCFANIVLFDVLHHVERPVRFLREAARVLRPGGRIVLCEPAITPLSGLFYRFLHPEPVAMRADPLADGPLTPGRDPYDANQAIPTLLFRRRGHAALADAVPALRLLRQQRLSLLAYPLSGGFRSWTLVPAAAVPALLRAEDVLLPLLGPLMAFRLLAVVERLGEAGAT